MPSSWGDTNYSFELTQARIVAALENGGVIVETDLHLSLSEGRGFCARPEGDRDGPWIHTFEYEFRFERKDCGDPEAAEAVASRLVIEGIHTGGRRMEIRGDGWIGYDDNGNIEGHFDDPPVIIIDAEDDEDNETEAAAPPTLKTAAAARVNKEPQPSLQYLRAVHGRSLEQPAGNEKG